MSAPAINWAELEASVSSQTTSYFSSLPPPPSTTYNQPSTHLSVYAPPSHDRRPFGKYSDNAHEAAAASAAQSPGKSISGLQNRLLATISEDIGRMQTSQKENFAEVIGREKENRSSTAELFERVGGLSRDFKSVEGDLSNVRRDMTGVKDLVDDLRGNFGRISGWIHEVEGVVGGDRGRIEVLGNQMMELQNMRSDFVSSNKFEDGLERVVGEVKRGVGKSLVTLNETVDERVGEVERMQKVIAREVGGIKEDLRELSEGRKDRREKVQLDETLIQEMVTSQVNRSVKQMEEKFASMLEEKLKQQAAALTAQQTSSTAVDELRLQISSQSKIIEEQSAMLRALKEEVETHIVKSKSGQKVISGALGEVKKDVASLTDNLSACEDRLRTAEKTTTTVETVVKKLLDEDVKKAKKFEDRVLRVEQRLVVEGGERREQVEGVELELGVLRLKGGEVESKFVQIGGRIRILEEEVEEVRGGADAVKDEVDKLTKKSEAAEAAVAAAAAAQSKGRMNVLTQLKKEDTLNKSVNDSFEEEEDATVEAKNLERENASKRFASSVPVRPMRVPDNKDSAVDEGESVGSEEETESESEEEDDFRFECTSVPIRGALRSSECDVLESVEGKAKAAAAAESGGGEEKAPRVGDRVKARWKGLRSWFKGVCISVNGREEEGSNGQITFHVQYDDGGIEKFVRRDYVMLDEDELKKKGGKEKGGEEKGEKEKGGEEKGEKGWGGGKSPIKRATQPANNTPGKSKPPQKLSAEEQQEEDEERKRLQESVLLKFPSQIFVRQWDCGMVKEWITRHVKLPVVADKFFEFKMNGEMIMDANWTVGDMNRDLSHETEGMGIDNEYMRARIMAFIKALRETNGDSRKRTLANYYNVWGEYDKVGDEEGDTA